MAGFSLSHKKQGKAVVVAVNGSLDAHTATTFEKKLRQIASGGAKNLVIDLSGVDYVASAGLGVLNGQLSASRKAGGDVRLSGINDKVRKVFDVLGYSKIFKIFPDSSRAVASF